MCVCVCTCVFSHFSCVQLYVTLWTVACQAPLSMGFPRQESWNGLPFPLYIYIYIYILIYIYERTWSQYSYICIYTESQYCDCVLFFDGYVLASYCCDNKQL